MKLKSQFHMGLWNRFLPMWKLWTILHGLTKLSAKDVFAIVILSHAAVRDKYLNCIDLYKVLIVNVMLNYVASLQWIAALFISTDTLIRSIIRGFWPLII